MKTEFITSPEFCKTTPINVFHKELCETEYSHPEKLKNKHYIFRKKIEAPGFNKATVRITADDYYKLYINGVFVTQGPASSYPEHYYYNEVDISTYLHEGENTVAVHVYYQGLINRVWVSGDMRCMLWAELLLDGNTVLVTDGTWRISQHTAYSEMGRVGYDTAFLECYDSSSPSVGFEEPNFDDTFFENARIYENADYTLFKQPTKQLLIYDIEPKSIKCSEGRIIADFGREAVGYPKLSAKGKRGDEVTVLLGEELNPDGSVRFDMRCNCRYEEKWILSGGLDTLSQFDYKAFRYMELRFPNTAELTEVKMTVRHYPYEEKAVYPEDNESLDKILTLCKDTIKYGTQEIFLDCPTREKGEYLGDLAISARAHAILTGDLSMIKKALCDFCLTAGICEGFMAVGVSSLMQEIADYSLLLPAVVNWVYSIEKDKEYLASLEPYMTGLYKHFLKFVNNSGLLDEVNDKWNLVDWPDNLRDGYDFPLTRPRIGKGAHNVLNAFWCGFLDSMDELYKELGMKPTGITERTKDAFVKEFYSEQTGLFCDCGSKTHSAVHSNILPLLFGIGKDIPGITDRLAAFIEQKGLESMGVYMAYFALAALKKAGKHDIALKLATSDRAWLNMLSEGATTTYEAWGRDQKWNTSLFHPWAVAPLIVFAENTRIY